MRNFLILVPLPILTIWLAYAGFTWVPQELELSISDKPASLIRVPQKLDGLKMTGTAREYKSENLFEYVNGHAEFFISSGFVSLMVADYSTRDGAQLVVEMYDMENSQNAKGTLMGEKGSSEFVGSIGSAAYAQKGGILFSKGRYYVRLRFPAAAAEQVTRTAKALAALIKDEKPQAITLLPLTGLVKNSESFAKSDYMGMSFLKDVSTASFRFGTAELEGFAWNSGADELIKFFSGEQADVKSSRDDKAKYERYVVTSRYEGQLRIVSNGQNSVGLRGDFSAAVPELVENFMRKAGENLGR